MIYDFMRETLLLTNDIKIDGKTWKEIKEETKKADDEPYIL